MEPKTRKKRQHPPVPTNPFNKDKPHPYRGQHLSLEHRAKLKVARRINLHQVAEADREAEEARILAELQLQEAVREAALV